MDLPNTDHLLFGNGLSIQDYFIDEAHGFEVIGFTDESGREFDVQMSDETLYAAALARLRELKVRIKT